MATRIFPISSQNRGLQGASAARLYRRGTSCQRDRRTGSSRNLWVGRSSVPNGDVRVLRLENVGMRYGIGPEILRDISFSLAPGSFHFLTGSSGAGKTTLLKLMYLALRPTRGLVHLFDRDISVTPREELPALRRRIGVVFQDFRLIDHMTAVENVALPLRVNGGRYTEVDNHVRELLSWVGLGERLDARPSTLSGGQQQRVAIARAVINRPRLLLADEPTGNVDDHIAVRLMHLFEELNKAGTTIVIATHNNQLVEEFGHPVMHLDDGGLVVRRSRGPGAA
ncbi:MAG: cell division ATP-binding protein FtsE [Rhodospirillaceae bacterium]|nr:cell division ATP-binding protein FtsE [Rhodospirillaceae bacterium]